MSFDPFESGNSVPVFDWLLKMPGVTPLDALVYGKLAFFRGKGPDRECWPSIITVANELGLCERDCRRRIAKLEKLGLIRREVRPSRTNLFVFADPATLDPVDNDPGKNNPDSSSQVTLTDLVRVTRHETARVTRAKTSRRSEHRENKGSEHPREHTPTAADPVFEYWKLVMGSPNVTLSPERASKLKARRRNYTDQQLKDAIDGVRLSDHHMSKFEWRDIASIFGSVAKVDGHIERKRNPPPKTKTNGKSGAPGSSDEKLLADVAGVQF